VHDALVLEIENDFLRVARATRRRPDTAKPLIDLPLEPGRDTDARLKAVAGEVGAALEHHYRPDKMSLVLRLNSDNVLSKIVKLPAATEENLHAVVGFEMERLTPFRPEDVCYDGVVVGREPETRQISVRIHVVPARVVNCLLALVPSTLGVPDRNRARISTEGKTARVEFLPPDAAGRGGRRVLGLLVVANAVLLGVAAGIPLFDQHTALGQLRAQLERARRTAAEANAVQARIDAYQNKVAAVRAVKSARPAAVEILEEVAARLPDSTWVQRIELKAGKLRVSGSSAAASALIALLEASTLLDRVSFVSPVTRDSRTGRERFLISAVVRGAEMAKGARGASR